MNLRNATPFDILKAALKALPHCEEGHVIVLVDIRDGSMEVLSKTKEFEDWAANSFDVKTVIFDIKKEAGLNIYYLYKKYRHEICCRILELKEDYPHLA